MTITVAPSTVAPSNVRETMHTGSSAGISVGSALEPRVQPESSATPPREPLQLRISAAQARALRRPIFSLSSTVRRQLAAGSDQHVILDLAAVPPTPACASVLALIALIRRVGGPGTRVTLTGVTPALRPCLTEDLDDAVTVIDRHGRAWPG